jgi:hypothetical protein
VRDAYTIDQERTKAEYPEMECVAESVGVVSPLGYEYYYDTLQNYTFSQTNGE